MKGDLIVLNMYIYWSCLTAYVNLFKLKLATIAGQFTGTVCM